NFVALPMDCAGAGLYLFEERRRRRDPGNGNGDHHAPLARRLLHRTCRGTSPRTLNRALEIVWRYDWHYGAWPANIAQRLLGPARALMVWANRSGHAFCGGDGNPLVGGDRN